MNKINNNAQPELKRNFFLTILLVLVILANAFVAAVYFLVLIGVTDTAAANLPREMLVFSLLICLGNIICGIGMWRWRRWGLIGYGIIVLTAFIVTGVVTKDFSNFFGLVGMTLLTILFYPFWKYMK